MSDTTELRDRIAALFRQPPGHERLGDQTPGEIADAVLAVLPAADASTEVYPTETSWIAEVQEVDDQWMYLSADWDRTVVEQRIAGLQKRFPQWKDGTPVNGRIIRKTTTYIVDTSPAVTEEPPR